jgi:hypothetical protein
MNPPTRLQDSLRRRVRRRELFAALALAAGGLLLAGCPQHGPRSGYSSSPPAGAPMRPMNRGY